MKITETKFQNLIIIKNESFNDDRGVFYESYRFDIIKKYFNEKIFFCQDNIVKSNKNVLRGLHYQYPNSQSKLISVLKGKILDIAVDIRKKSKTYGQFFSIVLSAENNKSLFVPKGFAHGYLSLESDTLVHYKVDSYYDQSSEKGIRYDDPFLNIDWGIKIENIIISEKDRLLKPFQWIRK